MRAQHPTEVIMQEYRSLALIVLAIFVVTLLGAYYSPTFEAQKTYLELFVLFGSLLFIFSALVVFATIGFGSFAIYGAIFLAAVMGMYGVEGALLVVGMTYLVWGLAFSMEFLLLHFGIKSAFKWFEERYTYKNFLIEYRVFYPMIWLNLIALEWLPALLYREKFIHLEPSKIAFMMREVLE